MTGEYSTIARLWSYDDGKIEVRLRRAKVLGAARKEELCRAYAQMWQQQAQLERDAQLIRHQQALLLAQQRELARLRHED